MIEKISQKLNQFYHLAFIVIMLGTLATIFYFWRSGFVDGSKSKQLHKANYILEQITTESPLKEIRLAVYEENPKLAISKLDSVEKKLGKLNQIVEDASFSKLKKESGQVKTSVANLISFSKTTKILSVFNSKLTKFNGFVKKNKWRTLTRTSDRILNLTKGHINKKKLSRLVGTIEKDFQYMLKVTDRSVLTNPEKSEIASRISNMQTETTMLKKYIDERDFFYGGINSFSKRMDSWIEKVSPELSYQKLQVEQMGRYYIMGLFGILALVSGLFFSSFIFQKWYRKNAQLELEEFLESFISDGLVGKKEQNLESFNPRFQNYASDIASYIQKRMSFGSIFQKALPLSSVMLDKNLKVAWANKQFCEDWSLSEDEINKDYLSWDYLSKLTNLGDNDPILEALKNKVAGIYQVQIKVNENAEVAPYEMFVSPTVVDDETRIMLFFYPLSHLQETIKDQAKSINNPIEKTLRLIASNEFNNHPKEDLQHEYDIAGISPLLSEFENIVSIFNCEQSRLVDQIEMLYQRINVLEISIEKASDENEKISQASRNQVQGLKAFKENVIDATTIGKENEALAKRELRTLNKTLTSFETNYNKTKMLRSLISELSETMPKFSTIKEEVKTHKNLLSDTKMRLSHSLSQMVHLKKKITDPQILERFNNSYERVGSEFKNLDTISGELEKKLTNLEVVLSKGQIVVNDVNKGLVDLDIREEGQMLLNSKEDRDQYYDAFKALENGINDKEDSIVENLRELYMNTKINLESNQTIAETFTKDSNIQ
jgi:hypothetical protein